MTDVPDDPAPRSKVRRRDLDDVFGDVLPDVTGDERSGSGDSDDSPERLSPRDQELLRDVPPHHG